MKENKPPRRGAEKQFNNPFEKLKALHKTEEKPAPKKEPPPPPSKPTSHDEDVALFLSRVNGTQRMREDPRGQIIAPKPDKNVTLNEMHDLVSQVDRGSQWSFDDTLSVWHAPGVPFALLRDLACGKLEPEARLDLHGLRAIVAEQAVEKFIRSAHAERRRCVLVITGRGESSGGVLRESIGEWLKSARSTKRVLAFVAAPRALGGDGATLVLLRRA
jgi:DNA-nicking Smr family endonuclease